LLGFLVSTSVLAGAQIVTPAVDAVESMADLVAEAIAAGESASLPNTLKNVPVPTPTNLGEFIVDQRAAIVLGKALFWDMQAGSDGVTSCASCHFHAGADRRSTNTLAPALLRVLANHTPNPDTRIERGANVRLTAADFPFHRLSNPEDRDSAVLADANDIVGSQGVFRERFGQMMRAPC